MKWTLVSNQTEILTETTEIHWDLDWHTWKCHAPSELISIWKFIDIFYCINMLHSWTPKFWGAPVSSWCWYWSWSWCWCWCICLCKQFNNMHDWIEMSATWKWTQFVSDSHILLSYAPLKLLILHLNYIQIRTPWFGGSALAHSLRWSSLMRYGKLVLFTLFKILNQYESLVK